MDSNGQAYQIELTNEFNDYALKQPQQVTT